MTLTPVILLSPPGPDTPPEASREPGFVDCRGQWHSLTGEED